MTEKRTSNESGSRKSALAWVGFGVLMLTAGVAIPLQGRINAALAQETADPYLAALLSFFSGAVLMVLIAYLTPAGRSAMKKVAPSFRSGAVRWWYLLAGCGGGYFVLTQTLTIGVIGVAVFTVAVVTGQTVGGLIWDRIGLGPAGRQRITLLRGVGALLTVVAVVWAVSPALGSVGDDLFWLLLVLLPFTAGLGQSAQQALNGRQSAAYRSPIPGTLFNFVVGTATLLLVWVIVVPFSADLSFSQVQLSTTWWHYLGGLLGIIFIALGALLVAQVGVLLTAMGMIAGQLLGSLMLDLVVPTAGSVVTYATVAGTALTLLAVVVASLPDMLPKPNRKRRG